MSTSWPPPSSEKNLTPQLMHHYRQRVEVTEQDDTTRRFIVGMSTGAYPCHVELANVRSISGPAVSGAPFKSVIVVDAFPYQRR